MKKRVLFAIMAAFVVALYSCQSPSEYCTVQGTIKGVEEGMKLEIQDSWNHFKVIETTQVKDGKFEFHPHISSPTHVYLYIHDGMQLKDFFLEPGTIIVSVDAEDESDMGTGATGTVSNDMRRRIQDLSASGDADAAEALREEVYSAKQTGPLALMYAEGSYKSSAQALDVLSRLMPELASKAYIKELATELTRRMRTEPRSEKSDVIPTFIDMEYADAQGNPISLSSVVNNPKNRYVLLDFWATWCSPCIEAIPELRNVYAKYHEQGLEIYSVSEDSNVEYWKSFLTENGMTWVNVRDDKPGRRRSKVWYEYALYGIPTVLLIDGATGEILFRDPELDEVLPSLFE